MLKKTLGLGFVAGIAVFAVALSSGGCSSTTSTTASDDGGGKDGKVTGSDGSSSGDDGSAGGSCPGAAPTKADLDGSGGWKPPAAANTTACSVADIASFKANFTNAQAYSDLVKGLPAGCASCLMGKEGDATWPVIVTDDTGQKGFINFGACYAFKSGSQACGQAVQYQEFCVNISCGGCADADVSSCLQDKGTLDACDANFGADIQANCPKDATQAKALDDACGNIINGAAYLCSTGPVDGGSGG